ncbi:MAG: hypothetical protein RSB77_06030 [Bacilli bacterium]
MKKYLVIILAILLVPFSVNAKDKYEDKIYDIVGLEKSKTVTIYLFHSEICTHCKHEISFLKDLKSKYGSKIDIKKFQTFKNDKNLKLSYLAKERMGTNENGVPFTVIGDKYYLGFSNTIGDQIAQDIDEFLYNKDRLGTHINIPFIGKVNLEKLSIPFVAIILGVLDGFNPCAMWILLFLINMLFNMKDRKKMWIIGLTFLTTSAFVYFLAMLGLSFVLGLTATLFIQRIIALVAIIGGAVNLKTFFQTKDEGCHVVDSNKRKKYFSKIKKFTTEKNIWIALFGVMTLAVSVNLVELACSAGFPTIFVSILDINNIKGIENIFYLFLYIIFFLIDDVIVFVVAMKTLTLTGFTTKYNKLSHLIGGIIMILIGLLLIFKPEWIMLNF